MSKHFLHRIKEEIRKGIPGESSHLKMSPINRISLKNKILLDANVKESAVAVILHINSENMIEFLLIQRSTYDGKHSGQFAFPGGKRDFSDLSLEHTARREAFEEVGIQLLENNYIGELTEVYIPISNFSVLPIIYFHESLPKLTPNEREVAEIFSIKLSDLLNEESISTMRIKFSNGIIQSNIPCFKLNQQEVWGATALILNELRDLILRI